MGTSLTSRVFVLIVTLLLAAALTACSSAEGSTVVTTSPIEVEDGLDGLARITLTESAATRLNIEFGEVAAAETGLVVPSAAVIIDPAGKYWVYTSPEPLVFVRQELSSVGEDGQRTYFTLGPSAGTRVVVTGVPELYGAEFGIGK